MAKQQSNTLTLSPDFSMPAVDYAGQGNAILGIRDGGKTYTAMKCGEQLMDAGIPILVFDPIGVWKNLKIGIGSNKGYPIVTAGGPDCDIRLTKQNAVSIVSAAMKEGINLVIDFYSPELMHKATWIHIAQEVIQELLYQNKNYPLRHIFIEEAAELIPQVIRPQHSQVYAAMESLARMGRNAGLGYTIINQRAEQINKAILELCNMSFLHKQTGKNSLLSIKKWLDIIQAPNVDAIQKSLPNLKKGQCWVIGEHTTPQQIQVGLKKTFHPDPKNNKAALAANVNKTADVSEWVDKLKKQLEDNNPVPEITEVIRTRKQELARPAAKNTVDIASDAVIRNLRSQVDQLTHENKEMGKLLSEAQEIYKQQNILIESFKNQRNHIVDLLGNDPRPVAKRTEIKVFPSIVISKTGIGQSRYHASANMNIVKRTQAVRTGGSKLGKCAVEILKFLTYFPDEQFTLLQVAVPIGYSYSSGNFNNSIYELTTANLVNKSNGKVSCNDQEAAKAILGNLPLTKYDLLLFKKKLSKCEKEIYDVLLENPKSTFTNESLAASTESRYSHTSGHFNNSIYSLSSFGLADRDRGEIRLNPELFFLL